VQRKSAHFVRTAFRVALALGSLTGRAAAAELSREASTAFERYIRQAEARIEAQVEHGDGFLFATTAERRRTLRQGTILTEAQIKIHRGELKVRSGLIHDWAGAMFIPNAQVRDVLGLVQAYDRHSEIYRPEVIRSRILSKNGGDFRVAMRLLKKKVQVVAVFDTEHAVHYEQRDENRWWSRSRSTRIAEIVDPGTASERVLAPGTGHGYLWRINSYWTFQELDGGTYVECEAISLTRDVPRGAAWFIEPIIRTLPRESLANTLQATRQAVVTHDVR